MEYSCENKFYKHIPYENMGSFKDGYYSHIRGEVGVSSHKVFPGEMQLGFPAGVNMPFMNNSRSGTYPIQKRVHDGRGPISIYHTNNQQC